MSKICLFCGKPLTNESLDWHPACIKRMFGSTTLPTLDLDQNKIIDENIGEGKTVPGVQKKFSYSLLKENRRQTFKVLNNEYIIKTESENIEDIVMHEWVGMKLANICGIKTVDCGVLNKKGQNYFITKRIDRNNGEKLPMEDFCQLSELQTEYKYNGSYEMCYKKVIKRFSDYPTLDKLYFYKIVLFSYIIGNTDMHLKNFSLYEINDKYQLTPAYDLVPVLLVFPQEEMALTIHGKNKQITKNDFRAFGMNMDITEDLIDQLNDTIISKKGKMINFINSSPLNEKQKEKFVNLINQRISLFL